MDNRPILDTWLITTERDGRTWRVDDFGPGRVRVTDINHPTGYYEWVDRASVECRVGRRIR